MTTQVIPDIRGNWRNLTLRFGNRPIDLKRVERLKRSITEHGYWGGYPIAVNRAGEIIAGQHRWEACKALNVCPPLLIVDDISTTALLTIESSDGYPFQRSLP